MLSTSSFPGRAHPQPHRLDALLFLPVVAALGIAPTFFVFAGFGVLALIFIITQLPETRGYSLAEPEDQVRPALLRGRELRKSDR